MENTVLGFPSEFRIKSSYVETGYITAYASTQEVRIQTYIPSDLQLWSFDMQSNGFYIVNKQTKQVITAVYPNSEVSSIEMQNMYRNQYQLWKISQQVDGNEYGIYNLPTNQDLAVLTGLIGGGLQAFYPRDELFELALFNIVTAGCE